MPNSFDTLFEHFSAERVAFARLAELLRQHLQSLARGIPMAEMVEAIESQSRALGTLQQQRVRLLSDLGWTDDQAIGSWLEQHFAGMNALKLSWHDLVTSASEAQGLLKENTPWVRADLPTAELVKVAANSFLATKISFINAMAEVCEASGGDVTVLAKAIGYDPRIGSRFLQAGIGFGGGCLPKDIRAFMARAEELGASQAVEFLKEIDAINLRARQRIIELVRKDLSDDLVGKKVAVLGAAFKPDSDDVRDSPALDIAAQIQAAGAHVTVHDPKAISNAQKRFPGLNFAEDVNSTLKDAEIVLHLTEWKIYREINPAQIKKLVKTAIMIDGRNALDRDLWRAAGWKFRALGRTDSE